MTLEQRVAALITAIATDIKTLLANQGNLTTLTTTQKTSLVGAINELKAGLASASAINDAAASSSSTYSSSKIEAYVTASLNALINGAPGTMDTLKELADLLTADQNAVNGLLGAIAKRVAVDSVQSFTAPEKATARANIGAQDAAAIGNPDADLVALYTAAKA